MQTANPPAGRGIKPLDSFRAHRRLAILVALIVALAGIPIAIIKGAPVYAVSAVIHVAPRFMKNLREDLEHQFESNTQYREFMQHTTVNVHRYDVLERALNSVKPVMQRYRRASETDRDVVERLQRDLIVVPVPDTYLITVSLQGSKKEDLDLIVNAVVNTYLQMQKEEDFYHKDERVRMLEERSATLQRQIDAWGEARTKIAIELSVSTFQEREASPYDKLIIAREDEVAHARAHRFEAEDKLREFLAMDASDPSLPAVQDLVMSDPGLNTLKSNLAKRRTDLLQQLSGLSPNHPAFHAIQTELGEIDKEISTQSEHLTKDVRAALLSKYVAAANNAVNVEKALNQQLDEQRGDSAHYSRLYHDGIALEQKIELARHEMEDITTRVGFLDLESRAPGFVRLETYALPAIRPISGGRSKIALIFVILGGVLGFVIPIILDMFDRRIRTANDIERLAGIPALGWLIEGSSQARLDFRVEQLRRLAARLESNHKQHGTDVFVMTAIKAGSGTTITALDLARALSDIGLRALAVETNTRNLSPRYAGATTNLRGLLQSSGATGQDAEKMEADITSAIVPADAGSPDRIALGEGGVHLNHLDRLDELLTQLKQRYKFILFDAPPLLMSADTDLLINRIGTVLLVVAADSDKSPELLRALRHLDRSKPDSVGFVVNRVSPFRGGYLDESVMEYRTGKRIPRHTIESRLHPHRLIAMARRFNRDLKQRLGLRTRPRNGDRS